MGLARRWMRGQFGMWAWVLAALVVWCLLPMEAQTPAQLVSTMAANEVAARNQDTQYSYLADEVSTRTGGHRWTEKVVETSLGPLHRLMAIDGRPLDAAEAKAESDRIEAIVRDPGEFQRLGNLHKDDEARSQQLLQLLPRAFLITPDGEENGCVRLAFHPNPSFVPSSYEERVAAAMAGTVSIREPEGRLCLLQARIIRPVTFGFGLLGRIESGGSFSLQRAPVDSVHWKSERISVHFAGRLLLMKSLTREQEVVRTQVRLLPQPVTLQQAALMTTQ
ncbi:MAG TPA: hypothetical protein VKV02_11890 [Acidobacteriaceae bacterium]|nr:hypothetical protein [Acidobacteriaceae bacterium]